MDYSRRYLISRSMVRSLYKKLNQKMAATVESRRKSAVNKPHLCCEVAQHSDDRSLCWTDEVQSPRVLFFSFSPPPILFPHSSSAVFLKLLGLTTQLMAVSTNEQFSSTDLPSGPHKGHCSESQNVLCRSFHTFLNSFFF